MARVLYAAVVLVVFGGASFFMGRSVRREFRASRDERDSLSTLAGIEGLAPTVIAAVLAIVGPILILAGG